MSSVERVQAKVEATRGILSQTMSEAIRNGQNLEEVALRSEELGESAHVFQHQSTELKRKLFWKNVRMKVFIGFAIATTITIIGLVIASAAGKLS